MAETKRDALYDWLRLIATVFVVIGHSCYVRITTEHGGINYDIAQLPLHPVFYSWPLGLCRELSYWVYDFHMPLFFTLSGAVLALGRPRRAGELLRARAKRLLIPYFLYGWLFMLPVKYWGGFYDEEGLLLAAKGLLVGQDSGHLWFLTALLWCVAAFLLVQWAVGRFSSRLLPLLLMAGAVSLLGSKLPFNVLSLCEGLQGIFWFTLGYVFEKQRRQRTPWGLRRSLAAAAILLLMEAAKMLWGWFKGPVVIVLLGVLFTLSLAKLCTLLLKDLTHTRIWQVLIRDLFYVYIFHDPLEYLVLKVFLSGDLLSTAWGCWAYMLCRTAGVFAVSMLLGEAVLALRRCAARLREKNTAAAG